MSTVTSTETAWQWPADVLELAARHHAEGYLQPLLEATRRLFPTAQGLRVFVENDPELRDVRFLVFEVRVPADDIPDYGAAQHGWTDELLRIYPAPRTCPFCLTLIPVKP